MVRRLVTLIPLTSVVGSLEEFGGAYSGVTQCREAAAAFSDFLQTGAAHLASTACSGSKVGAKVFNGLEGLNRWAPEPGHGSVQFGGKGG